MQRVKAVTPDPPLDLNKVVDRVEPAGTSLRDESRRKPGGGP
jgi:hypothetical protein